MGFHVYSNDLLQFSLTDMIREFNEYTIEIQIKGENKIDSYMLLSRSRLIFPHSATRIYLDLEKHKFFEMKFPVKIQENKELRHSRYLNFHLHRSGLADSKVNFNFPKIKSIVFQQDFLKKFFISFKFKKLQNAKRKPKIVNNEALTISGDKTSVSEDLYIYSLFVGSISKKSIRDIGRTINGIDHVSFSKKYSIDIVNTAQSSILNYGLIVSLKQMLNNQSGLKSETNLDIKSTADQTKIPIGLDEVNNEFRIDLVEIKQGGIISGAIGTGKTTLRLTLMEQIIQKGISILDIDYKGDAPRLYRFFRNGLVLVPGKNLHIDIFDQPPNVSTVEFVGILFRSFIESIHDGDLTPPQKHILLEAIRKTVMKRGNLESFYKNIIIASVESKEIIDNYQQQTAIALISKFNWLQSTMRNVFAVTGKSISADELAQNNIFLDLSHIQHSAPNTHIRFFLDMLITKLMLHYKNQNSENFSQNDLPLRKVIFLDETHMFMPNHKDQNLSRLEELVVTLRHKGLSVIATTTNPAFISNVFLDSSFIAQFRTESTTMQRSLGLANSDFNSIVQLPNFSFYLKSASTNYIPSILRTTQFLDNSLSLDEYDEVLTKYDVSYLDEFRIEPGLFEVALLESYIFSSLPIEPYRIIIRPIVKKCLIKYFHTIDKVNKENGYHQFLLQSYSDYVDDENGIPELKDQFYTRCFLYELLLMGFRYNFRSLALDKVTKNAGLKNFHATYKVVFVNLILFIDKLTEQQTIEDIL